MTKKTDLKPCPCGKVPKLLHISAEHDAPKWAHVYGSCCGEWEIEFRNSHADIHGDESMRLAIESWNAATRKPEQS